MIPTLSGQKTLDNLLLEVYAPGFKLEDFLMSTAPSNQHLPEKAFTCKDCEVSFPTAEDFNNHFDRLLGADGKETIVITGCPLKGVH